jgi:hypothetical protein
MNTALLTLRDLFTGDGKRVDAAALGAVERLVDGVHWKGLCDHALDVLDLNVIDLLISGWRRHAEIRNQMRITALDPTRTALVHVAEHTVESTHTPSLEVRVEGVPLVTLTLPVEVAFEVEAVSLLIRGGEIREVRPGRIMARGTVKLESSVILKRDLAKVEFPGTLILGSSQKEQRATPKAIA